MICFLFYKFFTNPEQNHAESFRGYGGVVVISVLLFKMKNFGTNSIAGLTDKTGTDVVLNSLVQLFFCHFKQLEGWCYVEGALNKRKDSNCR